MMWDWVVIFVIIFLVIYYLNLPDSHRFKVKSRLVECEGCGTKISTSVWGCPQCGKKKPLTPIKGLIVVFLLSLGLMTLPIGLIYWVIAYILLKL
jgi:hypothetical protein